jgi:hypothetical protein
VTTIDKETEELALGPWSIKTKHGYHADEVISALQKTIRRGDSDGATWWAHEANTSGLGAWVWRRLFIIASEDVGLAEPNAPAVIGGLWTASQVLFAHQKKPIAGEHVQYPWLQLLQATWYLARCPKNREVADLCGVLDFRVQRGEFRPIPDFCLDMHTARGRGMGRGSVHFEDEGPEGGRWCADEVEIDGNRYRKEFYRLWQRPANPASRIYKVVDPAPENSSRRTQE